MLSQTFELFDLLRLFFLFFLELLLSADNAVVLALLSSHLSREQRKKALFIGIISAFFLRFLGLFFVSSFMKIVWIQFLGALYLLYLSFHGMKPSKNSVERKPHGFWTTVLLIELFDFTFAFDSIIAGLAFITSLTSGEGPPQQKIWIVYAGAILGLITIRFAANILNRLIEHYPNLKKAAYLMIGWIGVKLAFDAFSQLGLLPEFVKHFFEILYWIVLGLLLLFGFKKYDRSRI